MTDRTTVEIPFALSVPLRAGPPRRVRLAETCTVPVLDGFDARHTVVTHDGRTVAMGEADGRLFVRAPWEARLPPERYVGVPDTTGGVKEVAYVEHDPTVVLTTASTVVRPMDRLPVATDEDLDVLARGLHGGRTASKRAMLRGWADACVVVDGDTYVPTLGVAVRVAHTHDGALRPVVEFGWGGTVGHYGTPGIVDWTEGWAPPGPLGERWRPGDTWIPEDVRIDPVGRALRRVMEHIGTASLVDAPHAPNVVDWSTIHRAVISGDRVEALATVVREVGAVARWDRENRKYWGADTALFVAVTDAVTALGPDLRAEVARRVDATPEPGGAPEGLDGLTFGA